MYKIGILGSVADTGSPAEQAAHDLAKALEHYSHQIIIITGACTGLPYIVANHLSKQGVEVWGYSPAADLEGQKNFTPNDDVSIYSKLIYNPSDVVKNFNRRTALKYRNVTSTTTCNAGIIISGRWGSLNEFTNLVDFQKVAGVLTGTGGITDELPALAKKISKEGQGPIVFDNDPNTLLKQIFSHIASDNGPDPAIIAR